MIGADASTSSPLLTAVALIVFSVEARFLFVAVSFASFPCNSCLISGRVSLDEAGDSLSEAFDFSEIETITE